MIRQNNSIEKSFEDKKKKKKSWKKVLTENCW